MIHICMERALHLLWSSMNFRGRYGTLKDVAINATTIAVALLIASSLMTPISAQTVVICIEADRTHVSPGEILTARVAVDPAGKGISAVDLELSFNPSILEALSISRGRLLGEDVIELFSEVNNTTGTIRYVAARIGPTIPPTPKEILISIDFRVKQNAAPTSAMIVVNRIGISDEKIADVRDLVIRNATIAITTVSATTSTPPTAVTPTIITTRIAAGHFQSPAGSAQMTMAYIESRDAINQTLLLVAFMVAILTIFVCVTLLVAARRRRRKPIIVHVE